MVITGLGLVTPLGVGVDPVWRRLSDGKSGIRLIHDSAFTMLDCRIAGRVPNTDEDPHGFDAAEHIPKADLRRMDRFIQFALVAAKEAIGDAGWPDEHRNVTDQIATVVATGIGGLPIISDTAVAVEAGRGARLSPFTRRPSCRTSPPVRCQSHTALKGPWARPL